MTPSNHENAAAIDLDFADSGHNTGNNALVPIGGTLPCCFQLPTRFFANARGRVGLQDTVVSNDQLTGRVEADFMVFHQGRCMILEVDGQHHLEQGQTIRDYARDRALLRFGVPTVRFTAKDCFERSSDVVSEFLSILSLG